MKDIYDCGLRGRLPLFILAFLEDRKFQVRVWSVLSELDDKELGVPQGSILSVTCFSLKINSIVKTIKNNINCSLYIDDFLICYSGVNMNIERQLQLNHNNIHKWSIENGFKFSNSKTVCMQFCQTRRLHNEPAESNQISRSSTG